jgi:hypothetical protein
MQWVAIVMATITDRKATPTCEQRCIETDCMT